ncbi:MAG: MoaD/ThiS family protein [Proteobacteria bacterium]|nr:MoaD/ThiS family protein [Pseudomonadota bacterium]
MHIRIKLFALLDKYLPAGGHKNEADMDVAADANVGAVLKQLKLPPEVCHLVLVNGVFVHPGERDNHALADGDHLAVWPPVAGGASKPVVIKKEMALTHGDFFRVLPSALGGKAFKKTGANVTYKSGPKRLEISLGPERTRQIAKLSIPVTDVTLKFTGYARAERETALKLFDRMFQKGGG